MAGAIAGWHSFGFSRAAIAVQNQRMYGNLQDKDRIFTNLYKDEDPFINGALKRGDWH